MNTAADLRNAQPLPAPGGVRDLRGWLARLSATGRVAIARPGASLVYEIAGLANRHDGAQALIAPQPEGHPTGVVVSGLLSRRGWMAEALGIAPDDLLSHFLAAVRAPLPCHPVATAPCHQVVHRDNIDLTALLPIPSHNEFDSGAYVTAGLVISRNPRTGVQNVSIHRLQVSGPRALGGLFLPRHTLSFIDECEAQGRDLEVSIVIGASPACLLASQAIVPIDFDELTIAGALQGAPLEVVRGVTNTLFVPADAEIVIEGRVRAHIRRPEGPFGEFPQYYGERADRHEIEVDCVTTRHRPLFHTIVGGGLEHLVLGGIPREATILKTLQDMFPSVVNVHLSHGGVCRYHLYVQMTPTQRGEVKNVILGAFAAHYDIKHVIVVDPDVDIFNPEMVEWAVATRFQADRDLVVIEGAQGSRLDPSTDAGLGAKCGFDATVPIGAPEMRYKRIRVPGEAELDLTARINPDARLADILGDATA